MHPSKLSRSEWIAVAGGLLLLVGIFLPWYVPNTENRNAIVAGSREAVSAWEAHSMLRFLLLAAVRGLLPGIGTVVQIAVVGLTADLGLRLLETPDSLLLQVLMLLAALPVLAVGIATYLGTHLGAGPAEAAALAWDPPVPFKWSYSVVQGGGALVGWLLGATLGAGTIAVILVLGPAVDVAGRLLRLDVHQDAGRAPEATRD